PISFMIGVQVPSYVDQKPCIGYVVPGSNAASSGFAAGDCITSINQQPVASWNDANKSFVTSAGDPLIFQIEHNGKLLQLKIAADNNSLEGMQALGLLPAQEARIGSLVANMPAAAAGLKKGDLILQIADQPVNSWYDLRKIIQTVKGKPVPVLIERDGQQLRVELVPKQRGGEGDYLIGIAPQQSSELKRFGFATAVREGAKRTWELIDLTVIFVQKLFSGSVSMKNIGGPITVVQVAGQAAQTDLSAILSVLAFISIQLGILNLLPIPILDGGHILFNLVELVIRRPVSIRVREVAQQIGMAMLLMLMVLAFYNDIVRLWG
ncbi:MAG: RIP metalloprotease RseP, partial [Deltaproteobacteria bacterium]|nr:RIP metalloprotease RseP [Deltaproteobacteria bacterium]